MLVRLIPYFKWAYFCINSSTLYVLWWWHTHSSGVVRICLVWASIHGGGGWWCRWSSLAWNYVLHCVSWCGPWFCCPLRLLRYPTNGGRCARVIVPTPESRVCSIWMQLDSTSRLHSHCGVWVLRICAGPTQSPHEGCCPAYSRCGGWWASPTAWDPSRTGTRPRSTWRGSRCPTWMPKRVPVCRGVYRQAASRPQICIWPSPRSDLVAMHTHQLLFTITISPLMINLGRLSCLFTILMVNLLRSWKGLSNTTPQMFVAPYFKQWKIDVVAPIDLPHNTKRLTWCVPSMYFLMVSMSCCSSTPNVTYWPSDWPAA